MPELRRIPVNGIELNVAVAGSGPAVLLLHGFPHTWQLWTDVMTGLSDRYRVIAPDLRGFGASTRARTGYDAATPAQDAAELLYALEVPSAAVVAIDAGTPPALLLALRRPGAALPVLVGCGSRRAGRRQHRRRDELEAGPAPRPPPCRHLDTLVRQLDTRHPRRHPPSGPRHRHLRPPPAGRHRAQHAGLSVQRRGATPRDRRLTVMPRPARSLPALPEVARGRIAQRSRLHGCRRLDRAVVPVVDGIGQGRGSGDGPR
ncbi:alpha/beta fold hydrolase [Streptomyces sp. NPDC050788]|uniref:alpha/beta fold hydrolase n=1 Tax=Streptomyces sp. NPDC050788 TaxID=3155041 RepID=UPI003431BB79